MPLVLRGRSKARLEIQWDGLLPVSVRIIPKAHQKITLYQLQMETSSRAQVDLDQMDFSRLENLNELDLQALGKWQKGQPEASSESVPIQKCYHAGCGQWGLARDDGYCRHCGRRIKDQTSYGFQKLEISNFTISLWNGIEGRLWKNKEFRQTNNGIYSMGRYEDKEHSREYVEILEEKYDPEFERRFVRFYELLGKLDLLDKYWKPPLASFQKEYQRSVWIYPRLRKEKKWRSISALSYIFSRDADLIRTQDIVNIGIQICKIAKKIHEQGYLWASLKFLDLVLTRNPGEEISIYLRARNIAWEKPQKELLDTCFIPWELFWDEELRGGYEVTEVYIIAILLYFLKAKAPNLLAYNSLSYPYGLPALKLFFGQIQNSEPLFDYFEATLNQALLLNPSERGYQTIDEFQTALEQLLTFCKEPKARKYVLDVGESLDVGDEKRDSDLTRNQDAVFITSFTLEKECWGLFVLCDGVSTATIGSGDMASRIIIETFREWWLSQSRQEQLEICKCAARDFARACSSLNGIVDEANRRIHEEAEKLVPSQVIEESLIMGSTITVGMIYHDSMIFGWLGDSPIYRIHPGFGWTRLNYDHNERNYRLKEGMPLEECFIEGGNALTHCVGAHFYIENHVEMHFAQTFLYPGEHIIVCSDGIPDYIESESSYAHNENYQMLRIASMVYEYERDSLIDARAMASILVSGVNRIGGGMDNLSAIVIRVLPENFMFGEKAYQRVKELCRKMQMIMRQAHLETKKIVPTRNLSFKGSQRPLG